MPIPYKAKNFFTSDLQVDDTQVDARPVEEVLTVGVYGLNNFTVARQSISPSISLLFDKS